MAGSLNQVILIGRLGADPEVRVMQTGTKVCNLRVATSETWRDKNTGERKEKTEWHSVVIWNDALVGIIEQYLAKGMLVHVQGKLQTRKWQDQSGADRYSTEVVVQGYDGKVDFWTVERRGGDGGQSSDYGARDGRSAPDGASGGGGRPGDWGGSSNQLDDDIPF